MKFHYFFSLTFFLRSPKGSALWMAPEVMRRDAFTDKIDIYAFGLILWQIWTQQILFENHTDIRKFAYAVRFDAKRLAEAAEN